MTADNLDGVPPVMDWMLRNAGAFKMISFQPAAAVGRTEHGARRRVTVEALWQRIAEGLFGPGADAGRCSTPSARSAIPIAAASCRASWCASPTRRPAFHPLFRFSDPSDERFMRRAMQRFGGLTCRLDDRSTPAGALARRRRTRPAAGPGRRAAPARSLAARGSIPTIRSDCWRGYCADRHVSTI